jgi:hypothetical protein
MINVPLNQNEKRAQLCIFIFITRRDVLRQCMFGSTDLHIQVGRSVLFISFRPLASGRKYLDCLNFLQYMIVPHIKENVLLFHRIFSCDDRV